MPKDQKVGLSVDVVKISEESLHKTFNVQGGDVKAQHEVEIRNDNNNLPLSASSDGGSVPRYGYPFAPRQGNTPSDTSKPSNRFTNGQEHCRKASKRELRELEKRAAPEKDLTLFAMRLAVLEKLATNVGTLGFIWATVVILGGYAITLKQIDFWFVTLILVTEGARIFSRSHELEWQHQDPGTSTITRAYFKGSDALHRSARAIGRAFSNLVTPRGSQSKHGGLLDPAVSGDERINHSQHPAHLGRVWSTSKVSFLPFMRLFSQAKHVSAFLYCMQILSAMLSIALSVWRLSVHDFTRPGEGDTESNHTSALIMFYSLTVFEALVFLMERAYWQYKISVENILRTVNDNCRLKQDEGCYTVRRFFYDVFAKCLTESVFEGLKMDLVDYALQWLQSDVHAEQLNGVRALFAFSSHAASSQETLRTIGTRQGAVERLLEMVTWKNDEEQDIREAAANLLCKLVAYDRTGIRVAAISGSIEGILSLLTDDKFEDSHSSYAHEYARAETLAKIVECPRVATHVQLGLHILINMAKNPINCAKIGATRGLLARLISFIDVNKGILRIGKEKQEETVWYLSLELLSLLAACPGASGKTLREDIAKVLLSITNLRNILNSKEGGWRLQELAASTLSSLAMDAQVREVIGRTGGIMRSLFGLFLTSCVKENKEEMKVAIKAGEALTLLALQDSKNCARMLRLKLHDQQQDGTCGDMFSCSRRDVVDALIEMMGDRHRGHLAIFILHSFCENKVEQEYKIRIAASTSQVMRLAMVMDKQREKTQEAAIGLASKTLPLLKPEEVERMFSGGGAEFRKEDVVLMVGSVLDAHKVPSMKLPRVRRFCLELVAALVDADPASFLPLFETHGFASYVDTVSASASDLENYATFSGFIGVAFHHRTMEHLVQTAIDKLQLQDRISFS